MPVKQTRTQPIKLRFTFFFLCNVQKIYKHQKEDETMLNRTDLCYPAFKKSNSHSISLAFECTSLAFFMCESSAHTISTEFDD